jgi:DNA-binding GntR family transcriptional regulator
VRGRTYVAISYTTTVYQFGSPSVAAIDGRAVPSRACALPAARVSSAIVSPSPSRSPSKSPARRRAASSPADSDERQDNVSRAYHDLRSVIVWGQLPPGARISERVIAERLGLSRTPVRSALHRLEQEGFVASAGRGRERRLIVAPLTRDDGEEVYFIVGHLEGLAARMAASLPAARRKTLAATLRQLNRELAVESRKREDASRVFDLDLEFHRSYVEGVVGPRLLTLHRAIKPQSERYSRLYITVLLDELSASVKEHEAIAASIAKGNPDAAQRAVESNWHNAAIRLARIIAQHGERGSWTSWDQDVIRIVPTAGRRKVRF